MSAHRRAFEEDESFVQRAVDASCWRFEGERSNLLGALVFEIPTLVLDPLRMGRWCVSTMAVAPMRALARIIRDFQVREDLASEVFGAALGAAEWLDPEGLERLKAAKVMLGKSVEPWSPGEAVGAHLGGHIMFRNDANYMSAACGELVSVDPLGRRKAMVCVRLKTAEVPASELPLRFSAALDAIEARLAPAVGYHQCGGGSGGGGHGVGEISDLRMKRPWPQPEGAWSGIESAKRDREAVEAASGEGVWSKGSARI